MEDSRSDGVYIPPPAAPKTPIDQACEALDQAAEWFREYETHHAEKRTPDGYSKAGRNAARALACEEMVASLRSPPTRLDA